MFIDGCVSVYMCIVTDDDESELDPNGDMTGVVEVEVMSPGGTKKIKKLKKKGNKKGKGGRSSKLGKHAPSASADAPSLSRSSSTSSLNGGDIPVCEFVLRCPLCQVGGFMYVQII